MAELTIPVHPDHIKTLQNHPDLLEELGKCATDFRFFLNYWRFKDQEHGEIKTLGHELWGGQETFCTAVVTHNKLYALKARKLGFTTIETAYDAWCGRFRDTNGRVHLFSRREDAAQGILRAVKFGMQRLPEWMRLPVVTNTAGIYALRGHEDDLRQWYAYPADQDTAVEDSCNHAHVDEWARMTNPQRVWQAIEPTMAGSCHLITTGLGPGNYSSTFWLMSMAGDTVFEPVFIPALERPDRDEAWYAQKKRGTDALALAHEYPMKWEDALSSGAEFVFTAQELDVATQDAKGPQEPQRGRRYIKSWDIGRHRDACVGIVLDVTDPIVDVVAYHRLREVSYPMIQWQIEQTHHKYPGGITVIEDNAAGEAVRENLNLNEREVLGFSTNGKSKPMILTNLKRGYQHQTLRFDKHAWPQLLKEQQQYQIEDEGLIQDSVMALAIGYNQAHAMPTRGHVHELQTW